MSELCALIFAGFCFTGNPIAFNGVDAGIGYRVHVETADYVAEASDADAQRPLDWRKAPKACFDTQCLYYWKHCAAAGAKLRCTYTFTGGWSDSGIRYRAIAITTADSETLARAENRIGLQVNDSAGATLLLERMTERHAEPPVCPDDRTARQCAPGP